MFLCLRIQALDLILNIKGKPGDNDLPLHTTPSNGMPSNVEFLTESTIWP